MTDFIIITKKNEDQSTKRVMLSKERVVLVEENVDLTCTVSYVKRHSDKNIPVVEKFNSTNTLDSIMALLNT